MSLLQRKSDSVSSCTPSVLCDAKWDLINDSILNIYAVNLQLGAMALCTGMSHALSSTPCSNVHLMLASESTKYSCGVEPFAGAVVAVHTVVADSVVVWLVVVNTFLLVCAGTLITAPIGRKFVLTADHCFVGEQLQSACESVLSSWYRVSTTRLFLKEPNMHTTISA